jgi:hypothetical protein
MRVGRGKGQLRGAAPMKTTFAIRFATSKGKLAKQLLRSKMLPIAVFLSLLFVVGSC